MLRIVEAVIEGCQRLALRNIWKLTYKPEKDFQIIIGTNGCGKSTLLELLTPLPASPSQFYKGGSLTIKIEMDGDFYTCINDFKGGSPKYSIIKHNEGSVDDYLVDNGNATVMREVVRTVFKITPELQQLMLGKIKFHQLTPKLRQYWIRQCTPVDLDFAFKAFNGVKSGARDTVGALKHLNQRIAVETSKLVDMDDVRKLETLAAQLQDELSVLMLNRERNAGDPWDAEYQVNGCLNNITAISKTVINLKLQRPSTLPFEVGADLDQVNAYISDLSRLVNSDRHMLTHYTDEYMNIEGLLKTLEETGVVGIDEIKNRLSQLQVDETNYRAKLKMFTVVGNDAKQLDADTAVVKETLIDIFNRMPFNDAGLFNRAEYDNASKKANDLKYEIDRRRNRISQMQNRLEEISHAEDVKCPKCEHSFLPGSHSGEEAQIKQWLQEMDSKIKQDEESLSNVMDYLDKATEYSNCVKHYRNITQSYPQLAALWERLGENNRFALHPRDCITDIYLWENDLRVWTVLEQVQKEIVSLEEALGHANNMSSVGSGHFTERGEMLKNQIESLTIAIGDRTATIKAVEVYRDNLQKLNELKRELYKENERLKELTNVYVSAVRNEQVNNVIAQHQNLLASTNQTLSQKTTLENIVRDLENSIETLLIDKDAYALIEGVLSPNDGFIAEQLQGTIQDIVSQLNSIIAAIWAYEITVYPCASEDEELNYRFPMSVNGKARADIAEGSEGQCGIIDLAFRIMAYIYLGLEGYPIYLDETGREFDSQHQLAFLNYIKDCLGINMFSQAFLVSHYAINYGSVLQADTVVIDGSNIVVPDKHNDCVTIEYGTGGIIETAA